tara:strand:- start:113 stop:325 length:213 start_codon:yes stop_codon:yes gene_type:complete
LPTRQETTIKRDQVLNWGEPLGGTDLILEAPPLACGAIPLFWMVYFGKVLIIQRSKMLETSAVTLADYYI